MATETRFNTVEDMVKWAVATNYRSTQKFQISDRTDDEWNDKEVGTAWEARRHELYNHPGRQNDATEENKADYALMSEALDNDRPETHRETKYWLTEAGSHYSRNSIQIAEALGAKVMDIWTKREAYRGSSWMRPIGTMTVPGILKRLGNTDIGQKIEAARLAEKLQNEKNGRNYERREALKAAQELAKHLQKLGLTTGMSIDMVLNNMGQEE